VLAEHAPGLTVDVVLADTRAVRGCEDELEKAAKLLGARLALAEVAADDGVRHDPELLAAAFREQFEGVDRGVDRGVVPPGEQDVVTKGGR
jgi:hypothetical protein